MKPLVRPTSKNSKMAKLRLCFLHDSLNFHQVLEQEEFVEDFLDVSKVEIVPSECPTSHVISSFKSLAVCLRYSGSG